MALPRTSRFRQARDVLDRRRDDALALRAARQQIHTLDAVVLGDLPELRGEAVAPVNAGSNRYSVMHGQATSPRRPDANCRARPVPAVTERHGAAGGAGQLVGACSMRSRVGPCGGSVCARDLSRR
jgi:hypothetical protein